MNRIKRYEKTHLKMCHQLTERQEWGCRDKMTRITFFWVNICVVYRCISLLVLLESTTRLNPRYLLCHGSGGWKSKNQGVSRAGSFWGLWRGDLPWASLLVLSVTDSVFLPSIFCVCMSVSVSQCSLFIRTPVTLGKRPIWLHCGRTWDHCTCNSPDS